MSRVGWFSLLIFTSALFSSAQSRVPAGTPARIIVTAGHFYTQSPPLLTRDDLVVTQMFEPRPIVSLVPLRGERAALELFLLVDNCSSCEPGSKFEDLRRFIRSQPVTTSIGIAYIQEGRLEIAQKPTQDREQAVKALNAPSGAKPSNPFGALAELIRGWNQNSSRHVVLMISNGIDPAGKERWQDPSADAAIEAAQRAGVTVYAIYHPSADYLQTDVSQIYAGQVQLSHVADETGGEAYLLSFGPLPSLAPMLADMADHLANQYELEFLANPVDKSSLQEVMVKSKVADLDLMVADKVWVSGSRPAKPTGDFGRR